MATTKSTNTSKTKVTTTAEPKRTVVSSLKFVDNSPFVFTKDNYQWMLIGLAVIIVGFLLMIGVNNNDPSHFETDIYSFRRITLAPIVVMIGFGIELFAIFRKK